MTKKITTKKVVFVLLGAVVLYGVLQATVFKKPNIARVNVAEVKKTSIIEQVSASGKIYPQDEVKVSSEVSGEVRELFCKEGDSVRAGQLLVRIRPDNLQSVVERTKANLNTQKANLSQSNARVAQAQARLLQTQVEFERSKKLFDQKVIAEAEFQTSKLNYEVALSELDAAKQTVEASKYTIASAEASLKEARETLNLTSIYAPMSGIVTKLSIEKGEKVVGTAQMAGTEILRISNLGRMEVRVDVSENDIVRVSLQDTVLVEVDAYAQSGTVFKGLVVSIANSANESALTSATDALTEFRVKILILPSSYKHLSSADKPYPFKPGMSANVNIITNTKSSVLSVPVSAVTTRELDKDGKVMGENKEEVSYGQGTQQNSAEDSKKGSANKKTIREVVFVLNQENKVELIPVKTGISDFENIEILEGLTEGMEVVSGPYIELSTKLKDGQLVEKRTNNNRKYQ